MTATLAKILNIENSQLGFEEGPNNGNPYGPALGYANHQRYCMQGQSWAFRKAGALDLIGGKSQNCEVTISRFKRMGRWHSLGPVVGDLVFFDWDIDGRADHVGLVTKVKSHSLLEVLEFNTSYPESRGGVALKLRSATYQIKGFGRPAYAATSRPPTPLPRPHNPRTVPLVIDGSWGQRTTSVLETVLRVGHTGTGGPAADRDTLAGARSGPALSVNTTKALQRLIGVSGDGVFGPASARALQRKAGADQDGVVGRVTVKAFQRVLNRSI